MSNLEDQKEWCREECDIRLAVESDQHLYPTLGLLINQCLGCGEMHHGELTLPTCKEGWIVCPDCWQEYSSTDCYLEQKRLLDLLRALNHVPRPPELPDAEIGVILWQ